MKKALTFVSLLASGIALAEAQGISVSQQGSVNGGALLSFLSLAQTLVARLVPFVIGIAILAFFWFLVEFIWKGREDGEAKKKALSGMGYSILALFVMVSIWGLIGFLGSVFGIGQGGVVPTPGIPTGPQVNP